MTTQAQRQKQANLALNLSLDWQPLLSGTSNQLLMAESPYGKWVLRLNASDRLAFGVNRQREAHILDVIQPFVWSPKIILNRPEQGFCVMQGYQQNTDHIPLSALWQAVNEWQQLPCENLPCFDYQALIQQYRTVLTQESDQPALCLLDEFEKGLANLPELSPVLVHHDLHAKNLCCDDAQLIVIDWEYGGVGSAWFDAVALYEVFAMPCEQIRVLPVFQYLTESELQQGIQQASLLNRQLASLWYWVRGERYDLLS